MLLWPFLSLACCSAIADGELAPQLGSCEKIDGPGDCTLHAGAFPEVSPWETEAFTAWTAEMLRPIEAKDDPRPSKLLGAPTPTPTPTFSRLFSGGSTETLPDCREAVGVFTNQPSLVPIEHAVAAAMANATAAGSASADPGGAVFIVANGANEGIWLR